MNPTLTIRPETPADIDAIRDVTVAAFATQEISGHTEQFIVAALRAAKSLMSEGLARLKNLGAGGCCLVGHPEYYRKFGFDNLPGLALDGVPPEVFLSLSFDGRVPPGKVSFHKAFNATA